jgi:GH24 family phage-related lysozyme (muramidase)
MAAGQVEQQTQQADLTARYQQFLQERGYPFQVAQFLANIAMGTGALSGSTTTTQQPGGFFSDKRLKKDVKEIGETHDGQPIYSYKYNGDDRTQIGLMAQDVEKKHPEAVGLMGGYKTVDYKKATEGAERTHKDMGGGLMPDGFDPNSMGGAVTSGMAGEGFMRGGYVGGGLVGGDDWAQILAANKQALGVYGGAQPMGGAIGAGGIVPQASVPVPKLITAGAAPQQKPAGLSTAMQTGQQIANIYKGGKETVADLGKAKDWLKDNIFAAHGGLIVPRHAYADGGMSEADEAIPYDPSDVMGGKDPMEGVLKSGEHKIEPLKPAQAPGGGGGGSGLGDVASIMGTAAKIIPFFFKEGGLVPRQGFDGGGEATLDSDPTLGLISKFEGFRDRPYQDVNALRTGFGSDTVTMPDGSVQRVGPDTRVTVEDARRDLARRAAEYQGQIRKSVGDDAWSQLGPNAQAALTSVTYNYGRLPGSVAQAVQGGDKKSIAEAVNALGVHNEGVNARRRAEEASLIDPEGQYAATRKGSTPPGLVGGGLQAAAAPSGGEGKKSLGDTLTSEGFVVPALGFLGSMLASNKPNLGQALGEGIMGGVGAYQAQRKMLPEVAKTEAEATQQNVAAINALSTGLKQYNAMNGTNLTLQQFAKLRPEEIAKYAGVDAASAVSGKPAAGGGYSYTPEEMESLIIKRPGQPDIPASLDPGYLNYYKAHYAKWGDNPYAKSQIAFADKQIERTGSKTLSATGEVIPTPGAIQTEQQALTGQQRVAISSDFEKKGLDFRPLSLDIDNHLDQLVNALQRFKTGADAPSRANLDKVMEAIDPNHKFPSLHGNDGENYDKIIKSAMAIQIAQLKGLSARAPAAELNALSEQIVRPGIDANAARQIVTNLKATNDYQRKMYDEYDPEKYGYNVSEYQKQFMKDNPYKEHVKKVSESVAPGVGTQEQRAQTAIPQSSEALDWARNNPSDPRSSEILKRLGVK